MPSQKYLLPHFLNGRCSPEKYHGWLEGRALAHVRQGSGKGIGHNFKSFSERFDSICQRHLDDVRARAFAFIFYDFTDNALSRILKDQGAFAQLDRLSGRELSIFYLHSGTRHTVQAFNSEFLTTLGVSEETTLPCVVFFRVQEEKVEDIVVVGLDNSNLIHGFHELYSVVEHYIKTELGSTKLQPRAVRWIKNGTKFVTLEVFRAALKRGVDFF
jgi:hypothetical protein